MEDSNVQSNFSCFKTSTLHYFTPCNIFDCNEWEVVHCQSRARFIQTLSARVECDSRVELEIGGLDVAAEVDSVFQPQIVGTVSSERERENLKAALQFSLGKHPRAFAFDVKVAS